MGHNTKAEYLAAARIPPRDTKILHRATSAVIANEDLQALDFAGAYDVNQRDRLFITICAMGVDLYVSFSPASVAADTTTVGQATKVTYPIPAGTSQDFWIERAVDRYLNFITKSGAGDVYVFASSGRTQGPG